MEDNLYPNDTSFFGIPVEPEEQRTARKKERAATLEAKKVIEGVIAHFQARLDFRDSISSVTVSLEQEPVLHQKIMEVNKLLKQALAEEKYLLEELLEIHAKNL